VTSKKDSVQKAFENGFVDRTLYGLLRVEQLYRRPWSSKVAWRVGWELANLFTKTPLRTDKSKGGAP
jgi:hypothetical protein